MGWDGGGDNIQVASDVYWFDLLSRVFISMAILNEGIKRHKNSIPDKNLT